MSISDTELLNWLEAETLRRGGFQIEVRAGRCLVRTVGGVGHAETLRDALRVTKLRQEEWFIPPRDETETLAYMCRGIARTPTHFP